MESLTFNLSQRVRRVTEGGRDYLVAPATLIKEGVLPGSKGPLYYPSEEIERTTHTWDGVPITINHPISPEGYNLSAKHPGVLERQGVGVVRNPVYKDSRVRAELWFDERRTKEVSPKVYNSLVAQKAQEVSTGLFTDNVPANNGAHYEGRGYVATARNYRSDHLAVLEHEPGACSVKDGCGILVNQRGRSGWQVVANANCGTGAGGFKRGNTCATSKSSGGDSHLPFSKEEGRALHRAVEQNPGDVPARMILSDWLEEYGDSAEAEKQRATASLLADYKKALGRMERLLWTIKRLDELSPNSPTHRDTTGKFLDATLEWGNLDAEMRERGFKNLIDHPEKIITNSNCGTGAGGFKQGNTCARGGKGSGKLPGPKEDEASLHRALWTNPRDEDLKKVYSDLLREQGKDAEAGEVLAWDYKPEAREGYRVVTVGRHGAGMAAGRYPLHTTKVYEATGRQRDGKLIWKLVKTIAQHSTSGYRVSGSMLQRARSYAEDNGLPFRQDVKQNDLVDNSWQPVTNESYFATCKRDDKGHCVDDGKPNEDRAEGGAGSGGSWEPVEEAKVPPQPEQQEQAPHDRQEREQQTVARDEPGSKEHQAKEGGERQTMKSKEESTKKAEGKDEEDNSKALAKLAKTADESIPPNLFTRFKRKLPLPGGTYGNFCGPGGVKLAHGDCTKGTKGETLPEPKNDIDAACKQHDVDYCHCEAKWKSGLLGAGAATKCTLDADDKLTGTLKSLEPKLPLKQKFVTKAIRGYFGLHKRVNKLRGGVQNSRGRDKGWQEVLTWQLVDNANCGTGAGGFKSGNTCAKGSGEDKLPSSKRRPRGTQRLGAKLSQRAHELTQAADDGAYQNTHATQDSVVALNVAKLGDHHTAAERHIRAYLAHGEMAHNPLITAQSTREAHQKAANAHYDAALFHRTASPHQSKTNDWQMSDEEFALRSAFANNPDDPLNRNALADWLEENSDWLTEENHTREARHLRRGTNKLPGPKEDREALLKAMDADVLDTTSRRVYADFLEEQGNTDAANLHRDLADRIDNLRPLMQEAAETAARYIHTNESATSARLYRNYWNARGQFNQELLALPDDIRSQLNNARIRLYNAETAKLTGKPPITNESYFKTCKRVKGKCVARGIEGDTKQSGKPASKPDESSLLNKLKHLPSSTVEAVKHKYAGMEERYGKAGAAAVMAGLVATTPLPGGWVGTIAAAEGLRAGYKAIHQ